ncbi:MAG: hypothetical protein CMJ58_15245 [Planctomycetaceae bacterium]|nr:hypothetical protein [Planctomycetaceae bacterium]
MSGSDTPSVIAWDSCVFLAWFENETGKPLHAIEATIRDVEDNRVSMIVSAIVVAEVLNKAGESEARDLLKDFCKRSNVICADTDFRIAEMGAVFREKSIAAEGMKKLKAPDALIAATASLYKANVLYSFDPDLLLLSGSPVIRGLSVARPGEAGQKFLDFEGGGKA